MEKHIRKYFLKFMIGVILLIHVAGGQSVRAAQQQTREISGSLEIVSNIDDAIMQEYVKAFSKKYPDVDVTYTYYVDYETEVKERIDSGDYGDVLFVPSYVQASSYSTYFAPLGTYEELEKKYNYLERSKYVDQTVYGIPSSGYISGILYNKDVFYKAGISDTPKSIDEFLQDLRDIKERTNAIPFYTNYAASWSLQFWEYFPYIEMTGNPDYKENIFVNESNPYLEGTTHYKVYKLLYDIVKEGLSESDPTTTDWEKSKIMLNRGEIGCIAIGSWAVSQFKEAGPNADAVAFMPFPNEINGRQYMTISTDYCYAISSKSENKPAAKAYIDFMLDESGYALDHQTLSVVKTDPYPDSYGNMENVILLSNNPASGENYQKKLKLTEKLYMEDGVEAKRVIEAAYGLKNETFDQIASDWNARWESSRTQDMEVSENEVKALLNSVIVSNYEVNFSQTEQQFLKEQKKLKVGYVKNMAPFQYENEEGFTGLGFRICEIIKENTGLIMEYYPYGNTQEMVQALKSGEIDMVAGMDEQSAYDSDVQYSKEYISYMNVVVRNAAVDMNNLKNGRAAIALGEETSYSEAMESTAGEYENYASALKAVDNNKEDYTVMNYYSADYYIQEQECNKVSVVPLSEMSGMCFAFPEEVDTRLVSICNKCIYGIKEGNIQVILREYMEPPAKEVTLKRFVEANPFGCLMAVSAVFLLIVAAIVYIMHEKDKSAKKHALDVKRYEILSSIVDEAIFEYDFGIKIFHFDSKLQEKFGLSKDMTWDDYKHDNENLETGLRFYYQANKNGEDISQPFQLIDKNGEKQWYKLLSHMVYDSNGKPKHIIGKLMNVQKEMEEMQQIEDKAQRDPLTGIYNRQGFHNRLDQLYTEIDEKLPMTVAVMDFDNFKSVNDILGHAGGDAALQLLANTLTKLFPENAIVARYGGDEFMLCIYNTEEEKARELLGKLVQEMDREFTFQAITKKISISVGAVYTKENVIFQVLYKEADKILYHTKNNGRNGYQMIHHLDEI